MGRTAVASRIALALGLLVLGGAGAHAQGGSGLLPGANGELKRGRVTTCSARNGLGTKQCTATCQPGQNADCEDADAGADPTCQCSDQ